MFLSDETAQLYRNYAAFNSDGEHIGTREELDLRYVASVTIHACEFSRADRQNDFFPLHEGLGRRSKITPTSQRIVAKIKRYARKEMICSRGEFGLFL